MKFQEVLTQVLASNNYKKFKKENKNAFLCSGFFSIDKEGQDNQQHLDFYVPELKKVFSFKFEDELKLSEMENIENFIPNKISPEIEIDFDKIQIQILKKINKEEIKNKIQKILLSLQNKDEKEYLIGTIFLSGLGLIKFIYDLKENEITDFEKKSFFDVLKVHKK